MNLAPPASQKAAERPISFVLDDRASGGVSSSVDLVIRPEDLTKVETSRLSVQQTLGSSVWADNFGPGLASITISGHTGWKRREGSGGLDGLERFERLENTVFKSWHERRRAAVANGADPDLVRLVFADVLDRYTAVVAPMNFTLRRSRSRPLLMQYQISLTVLNEEIGSGFSMLGYLSRGLGLAGAGVTEALGLESLTSSVDRITGLLQSVQKSVDTTIAAPLGVFMNQTARLYGSVRGAISAGSGIAGSLIGIAQTTAQAGVNIFRTLAAIADIPRIAKTLFMQVGSAYLNILCVLRNALRQQVFYQDYSDVYGSSSCSSTSGGRPISSLAGENPFYRVVPTREPLPVAVSTTAQASLGALSRMDPVLAPMNVASLGSQLRTVSSGLVVS